MAHAEAHYNDGWDMVVECMTLAEIEDDFFTDGPNRFGFFADRKAMTLAEAIEVELACIDIREDRQAEANYQIRMGS